MWLPSSDANLTEISTDSTEAIYRQDMAAVGSHADVNVERWIAELAVRLGDRLPEVVSAISASLRQEIPELGDQGQIALLNASVEGNVTTALDALRHNIPVERVQAPTAALEHAAALGPRAALTGPAARGDAATIARHVEALPDEERALYETLSEACRRLAACES